MGFLHDMMRDDLANSVLSTDAFGEAVTYRKRTGETRAISAQVMRYSVTDENGRPLQRMVIGVLNDATRGIASSEFDEGGDTVLVSYRGEAATYRHLFRPADGKEDHHAAWMWLEAR